MIPVSGLCFGYILNFTRDLNMTVNEYLMIGSVMVLILGIQQIINVNRLEKLQADYNSLNIHYAKDGAWTQWGPWDSCSATCGGGIMSRTRTCSDPSPSPLGKYCDGEQIQFGPCSQDTCPFLDGAWTQWGPWDSCSATCGGGIMSRTRTCSNPAPSPLGKYCDGEPLQYGPCSQDTCPFLDGAWTQWGPWDSCSATCGGGIMSRTRTCSDPAPSQLGKYCDGEQIQYGPCSQDTCPYEDLTSKLESFLQSQRTNIAFTAFLSKPATQLSPAQIIPFDEVELNEGQGFNTNTHIFTCPVPGIYVFQTGLLSTHRSIVLTEIVKEGKQLVQAHAEPGGNLNQGFNSVITKCDKGENVWVRIDRYGNAVENKRYTTFSGFLIWGSK